jgi:hypothetical protein
MKGVGGAGAVCFGIPFLGMSWVLWGLFIPEG